MLVIFMILIFCGGFILGFLVGEAYAYRIIKNLSKVKKFYNVRK